MYDFDVYTMYMVMGIVGNMTQKILFQEQFDHAADQSPGYAVSDD